MYDENIPKAVSHIDFSSHGEIADIIASIRNRAPRYWHLFFFNNTCMQLRLAMEVGSTSKTQKRDNQRIPGTTSLELSALNPKSSRVPRSCVCDDYNKKTKKSWGTAIRSLRDVLGAAEVFVGRVLSSNRRGFAACSQARQKMTSNVAKSLPQQTTPPLPKFEISGLSVRVKMTGCGLGVLIW